jgi:hypothetical protein
VTASIRQDGYGKNQRSNEKTTETATVKASARQDGNGKKQRSKEATTETATVTASVRQEGNGNIISKTSPVGYPRSPQQDTSKKLQTRYPKSPWQHALFKKDL